MADMAVTNTFVDATPAEATEVNTNFTDIVDWVNTNAIRKDGTVAFTGAPSYAADPSGANVLTRKQYVDQYAIPTFAKSGTYDSQTQPAAENLVSGSTVTISNPGYDYVFWGVATISLTPSTLNDITNLWELKIKVNSVVQAAFRIPLVVAGQSLACVLAHQNINSGTSASIQVYTENVASGAASSYTADVVTSTTRSVAEYQWNRR